MAMNIHTARRANWMAWTGFAVLILIGIAGFGYGFDWFGAEPTEAAVPATEQAAPVSE